MCDPKRFVISESSLISSIFEPFELDAHESSPTKRQKELLLSFGLHGCHFSQHSPIVRDENDDDNERKSSQWGRKAIFQWNFMTMRGNHFRSRLRVEIWISEDAEHKKTTQKLLFRRADWFLKQFRFLWPFLVCLLLCKRVRWRFI